CRLILDLRMVNQNLCIPKFKYEGLNRVAELVHEDDWMFAVDLKSGYHHVDIHPSCWKFLGFQFDGRSYVFRSLPFGLATAPFVFTQLIKQLSRRWQALGVRVIPYVDDIPFLCRTAAGSRTTGQMVVQDLRKAGLVINSKKSHLQPTQQLRPNAKSRSATQPELPACFRRCRLPSAQPCAHSARIYYRPFRMPLPGTAECSWSLRSSKSSSFGYMNLTDSMEPHSMSRTAMTQ
ncbi:unnamed protein product, partial [Closterium sp. NIES-53]